MIVSRRLAGAFLVFFCLAPFASGQVGTRPVNVGKPVPPPPPDAAGPMTLSVFVTDKSGVAVTGLQQQDFSLFLDKKPQTITAFHPVDSATDPVEVIILIDTVNTRFNNVAVEREQIDKYLSQNGGKLANPTSFVFFSDTDTQIMPTATRDGNLLRAQVDKTGVNLRDLQRNSGFYGYAEELDLSLQGMLRIANYEASRPGRKMLLWISPGWRPLSGPEVELTDKQQQSLFSTLVAISTALRQARITLSSIDPLGTEDAVSFRTFFYEEFLKGVSKPSQMQIGNLLLEVFALQTGGRVMNSSNNVVKLISTCAADADAMYRITFTPPVAQHPDQYYEMKMLVDQPKFTAHTLSGYYAQPPQAGSEAAPVVR